MRVLRAAQIIALHINVSHARFAGLKITVVQLTRAYRQLYVRGGSGIPIVQREVCGSYAKSRRDSHTTQRGIYTRLPLSLGQLSLISIASLNAHRIFGSGGGRGGGEWGGIPIVALIAAAVYYSFAVPLWFSGRLGRNTTGERVILMRAFDGRKIKRDHFIRWYLSPFVCRAGMADELLPQVR